MNIIPKADIVLSSNTVFTGVSKEPIPASIAIVGNKIAAIGSEEEIAPYIGKNTKTFQYHNKLIMAGFYDFHLHVMLGSLANESVNLVLAKSEEMAAEMVRAYADARPEVEWIIGFTWDAGYWDDPKLPNRFSLDRILPARPVLLFHAEGHYVWVNSRALELANITKDTEEPSFGRIERDEHGEPTGILYESAIGLVADQALAFSQEKKNKLFQDFLDLARKYGVTSAGDLYGLELTEKMDDYHLFKSFEERGELTARIHLWPALNGDLERAKKLRKMYQSDKLAVSGLKQFIDGVITGYTAFLLEPYADNPSINGSTTFPPEVIKQWVVDADREGFGIRFHAIGDGAIRLALDAFEEAREANGIRDSRHAVEHIEVIHPDDIRRFKQLEVIASMQPDHLAQSERGVYTSRIGLGREKYVFPINTLKESGAKLAIGTDFPIGSLNPMLPIYRAITRVDNSGLAENVWHAHEQISLGDALYAYTAVPAYGSFRDHELGTLEVGKLADIIVLDRDLFQIPAEEILDAKIILTVVDGEIVYKVSE